ncbi:MAG TPA: O-antigen polymerase [Niabella sp.]|nr:O-antigen polymerase [Niabella sp.]
MLYLFSLFFLGFAPILQFHSRSTFFGARLLDEDEYFFMNLLIISILFLYQFFYTIFTRLKLTDKNIAFIERLTLNRKLKLRQILILITLSLISFSIIFYINNFSMFSMLIRGGEFKEQVEDVESSTMMLIVNQIIRPVSFISMLYFISTKTKNIIAYILLLVLALITCSPLGMPRFAAAAMYIPFFLILISFFRKKNVFSLILILGLLVVFPFLDSFRHFSENSETTIGLNTDMFNTGNFDSYQNFALIVFENLVTWGRQLLGVFLFWVPRSIWPNKPIGSGAELGENLNFSWTNVSANYFAEGYINFGYFGIILFTLAIAVFNAKMDNMYWRSAVNKSNNLFKVIYYILLGMIFFILRGDLLSSFAFTVGYLISIFIVFKIAKS